MNAFKFSTVLGLLFFTDIGRANPLDNWTARDQSPSAVSLSAIIYGNGQLVAVGDSGTILTSADGMSWAPRQSGTTNRLSAIAYGNGRFVAVGGSGRPGPDREGTILTSADGVNWLQGWRNSTNGLSGIAYGNGQFVAVGSGGNGFWEGTIVTSTDGVNSLQRPSVGDYHFSSIAYGNGQFVATGEVDLTKPSPILTSADGVSWARRGSWQGTVNLGSVNLSGIAYGNGQFVTVGSAGGLKSAVATSTDGVNWIQRQLGTTRANLSGIAFGTGQFVAVGIGYPDDGSSTTVIWSSPDGLNWIQRRSGIGAQGGLSSVVYGDGHFLAVGENGTILESGSIVTLVLTPKVGAGLLTLSLTGPSGIAYAIETSTDLISWRNLTNIIAAQTANLFLDTRQVASDHVFFRAHSD